jgi:hypothetical protein
MDYIAEEQQQQVGAVRRSVLSHMERCPEALLVVEEYDKMDCPTRAMLRQLLHHPELANISLNRWVPSTLRFT